jgi:hypothetical protein
MTFDIVSKMDLTKLTDAQRADMARRAQDLAEQCPDDYGTQHRLLVARLYAHTYQPRRWDYDYVKAAREALARPDSFGYSGELPLFESWGLTFSVHRDSDALERSNFRRIREDIGEHADVLARMSGAEDATAEQYVDTVSCSHWAVGWMDHLAVRVLIDPDGEITPENITPVFKAATDIAVDLRDEYPAYDEDDLSDVESEDHYETWTNVTWPDYRSTVAERDNLPEDLVSSDLDTVEYRDESDYLDAMDSDMIYSEIGHWASEDDPSTWTDDEITEAVARVAAQEARLEHATRTPIGDYVLVWDEHGAGAWHRVGTVTTHRDASGEHVTDVRLYSASADRWISLPTVDWKTV